MELNHLQEGKITIINIKGRLDAAAASAAGNAIQKIIEGDGLRILFNFNDLEYLSSSGLKVILGAAKELRRKDSKFVLCSLNQFVEEIFVVSGINSLIPITNDIESGIKLLSLN